LRVVVVFFLFVSFLFAKIHITLPEKPFDVYYKKGKLDGPKILIVGGIHGDEIAGYKSADLLADVEVLKGELLIIPRANFLAILNNSRGYNGDLNRKFKKIKSNDKDKKRVEAIKSTILNFKPDVLISLHEGYGFAKNSKRAWGNSIVIDEKKFANFDLLKTANFVKNSVNRDLKYKISVKNTTTFSNPRKINLETFMLTDWGLRQNIKSFAIESSKNMELKERVKTHLLMLENFFNYYGLKIKPSMEELLERFSQKQKTPTIVMKINNKVLKVNQEKTLLVEEGSKVEVLDVRGPRGSFIVPRGVDLNWKSFRFRNVAFDVKIDSKRVFTIRVKEVNRYATHHKTGTNKKLN